MIDLHIIARGGGVHRNLHQAATGRIDGRALGAGHIDAVMHAPVAVHGVQAIAKHRADVVVVHGADPAAGMGHGNGGGVVNGGLGLGLSGQPGFVFTLLGCVELVLFLGDLLHEGVLLLLTHIDEGIELLALFLQLDQQLIAFATLDGQSGLVGLQLGLGLAEGSLLAFQLFLGGLHLTGGHTQLLHTVAVGLGDLVDDVDAIQEIGKAVGAEQNAPVGNTTVFLHNADTLHRIVVQLFIAGHGMIHLVLLLGDHLLQSLDLLLHIGQLLVQQADLLIQHSLLCHDVGDLIGILLAGLFQLSEASLDILLLALQLIDLLLDLAGGGGHSSGGHKAKHQRCHQANADHSNEYFTQTHCGAPLGNNDCNRIVTQKSFFVNNKYFQQVFPENLMEALK